MAIPTRRSIVKAACAGFLGGAIKVLADDEREFILRSHSNLVVLDVSVTGSDGVPLAGLEQSQFRILEDGKSQPIKQFSSAEAPVSIGFVIDMSGSMRTKLDGVRRATSTFLDASNPRDEYFLIGFNDTAWVGLPTGIEFSSKRDDIRKALLNVRSEGRTSLYDGIVLALTHVVKSRYERRVLVLITDGKDTASKLRLSEVLQYVRSTPVTIYAIGLFSEDDEDSNRGVLRQLVRVTGGRFYEPRNPLAVEQDCTTIARDIRARYTLAYTPPEEARASVRKIRVDLLREAGIQKASVRARSEYSLERPIAR